MTQFGILEVSFLVILTIYINWVSGLVLPTPENLRVEIWDGEATAHWSHPKLAPTGFYYNVELAKYTDEWKPLDYCTGIRHTYCDLSSLIHEYNMGYKVKVQLVVGTQASAWIWKKFLPNTSKLRPPIFALWPTSSSLTVFVYQKPILLKLFPFGVIYNVYLEQKGEDRKNVTALLKGEDQNTTTFRPLHRGAEYCVSARVQGQASQSVSTVSPKQCVLLPEREWYIIAVTSLSMLAVLAFASIIAVTLFCYLKRPEKTPAVLKMPVSGWLPLSVREGTMEVVTDKGWLLSSYQPEAKDKFPVATVTPKDHKVEESWTSMDSGVSMEANSAEISRRNSPERHDDSGCGSLSGSESSISNQTDYPLNDGKARTAADSRMDLDCQLRPSSANLDEQDSASPEVTTVAVGNYRSQSPSAVLEPILCHPVLAEVVSGYRAAAQVCICSGAGQCTWCHKQALNGKGVGGQYRAMCADYRLRSSTQDSVDSCEAVTFLSYPQKSHQDSFTVEDRKSSFIHLEETFPMLTALAPQDINMNFSLSLCDVQMAAD